MVASPMQDPFNFIGHQHRGNARGGLNKLPNDNTIHQNQGVFNHNFEEIPSNFIMDGHPGTYVEELRGQLGTAQGYFGPNMNHFIKELRCFVFIFIDFISFSQSLYFL